MDATSYLDGNAGERPAGQVWKVVLAVAVVVSLLATAWVVGFDPSRSSELADEVGTTLDSNGESVERVGEPVSSVGESAGQVAFSGGPVVSDANSTTASGSTLTSQQLSSTAGGEATGGTGGAAGVGSAGGAATFNQTGGEPRGELLNFLSGDLDLDVGSELEGLELEPGVGIVDLPLEGPLSNAFMDRLLPANIGTATGAELAHLGAHLIDDHTYAYADFGEQPFELHLDFIDVFPGAEDLVQHISNSGDSSALLVIDLEGDYFYLSVDCAALETGSNAKKERPATQDRSAADRDDDSPVPGAVLDISAFDPGGCGIGWSVGGNIPFEPFADSSEVDLPSDFGAHVVIDGTVPIGTTASVDGEIFTRFDDDRVTLWANAELDLTLSPAQGLVDINIPAARGTVGAAVGSHGIDLWVAATAGTSAAEGSPAEIFTGVLPARGHVDLDAELHLRNGGVTAESFLQVEGELVIGGGNVITNELGVDVGELNTADAFARIDATGIELRGSVSASPVGAFQLAGEAELDLRIPFADITQGYFEIRGTASVGDTALGANARLRVDNTGIIAEGLLEADGMAAVHLEGWIGADGFQLTGAAEVVLPIGDLDQVAANLLGNAATDDQIRALDVAIDQRISEIAAADPARGAELRTTVNDLRQAFRDVARINDDIATNDAIIADIHRRIDADVAWHYALNDFDQFFDVIPHGARQTALYAELAPFEIANAANYVARDTANAFLGTTTQIVLGIVGWDDELNSYVTLQAEAYWGRLTVGLAATVLVGADAILDGLGVDGSAHGAVEFTVGTQGLSASVNLSWCRDGRCSNLADASVTLTPRPEVCATILGAPACVGL